MSENNQSKRKWELVYDAVMNLNYGDSITHTELEAIIGEPYGSDKYNSAINRAKKSLLKNGKNIESLRGIGYRVIEPDAYAAKSVSMFRQGFNYIKKGNDNLVHAPTAHMSKEGLAMHRNVSDRVGVLYAHLSGAKTELNLLTQKNSAYLPENLARK